MKHRQQHRQNRQSKWSRLEVTVGAIVVCAAGLFGYMINDRTEQSGASSGLDHQTSSSVASSTRAGRANIIDGDTIEIGGERIRFNGIDAPEAHQTCRSEAGAVYRCGAASARFLHEVLASSRPTRCDFVEWDQYGRFVGDCYLADGRSVNSILVSQGHAVDWPRYSGGTYADDEATARREGRGLWRGAFEMPWNFRAGNSSTQSRISPLMAAQPAGSCEIKGNISSKGERIYHVPGQMHYDRTRISTSRGERWFCSESDARAAGWRKAKR